MSNHPLSAASFFFADPPASGGVRSGYATPATRQEETQTISPQKKGPQTKHKHQKSHRRVCFVLLVLFGSMYWSFGPSEIKCTHLRMAKGDAS